MTANQHLDATVHGRDDARRDRLFRDNSISMHAITRPSFAPSDERGAKPLTSVSHRRTV